MKNILLLKFWKKNASIEALDWLFKLLETYASLKFDWKTSHFKYWLEKMVTQILNENHRIFNIEGKISRLKFSIKNVLVKVSSDKHRIWSIERKTSYLEIFNGNFNLIKVCISKYPIPNSVWWYINSEFQWKTSCLKYSMEKSLNSNSEQKTSWIEFWSENILFRFLNDDATALRLTEKHPISNNVS